MKDYDSGTTPISPPIPDMSSAQPTVGPTLRIMRYVLRYLTRYQWPAGGPFWPDRAQHPDTRH
jgi:hypothetical protein